MGVIMSNVLYRKWRPLDFDSVIGQNHITTTLKNQVINKNISHAYLFCGTRGTGKTTCARILAKAANCYNIRADGNPCNECQSCSAINNGGTLDIFEIDAASHTGVDNIRELREEAVYAPALCEKRIYIIDEVHMLSYGAFNAFLKILEEPPSHVMFILATTDVQKLPPTILSRCQRFDFKRIKPNDISEELLKISKHENILLEKSGADIIAKLSDGAMRNALSLLERCSAVRQNALDSKKITEILGLSGFADLCDFAMFFLDKNSTSALDRLSDLYEQGLELTAFIDQLASLMRDILMIKNGGDNINMLGALYDRAEILSLAKKFTNDYLLFAVNLLHDTFSKLNRSANKRIDTELCLIELCNPSSTDIKALSSRISALEQRIAKGVPVIEKDPTPVKKEVQPPPQKKEFANKQKINFTEKLMSELKDEIEVTQFWQLQDCSLFMDGNTFIIECEDALTQVVLNDTDFKNFVSAVVSKICNSNVNTIINTKQKDNSNEKFDDLVNKFEGVK